MEPCCNIQMLMSEKTVQCVERAFVMLREISTFMHVVRTRIPETVASVEPPQTFSGSWWMELRSRSLPFLTVVWNPVRGFSFPGNGIHGEKLQFYRNGEQAAEYALNVIGELVHAA